MPRVITTYVHSEVPCFNEKREFSRVYSVDVDDYFTTPVLICSYCWTQARATSTKVVTTDFEKARALDAKEPPE